MLTSSCRAVRSISRNMAFGMRAWIGVLSAAVNTLPRLRFRRGLVCGFNIPALLYNFITTSTAGLHRSSNACSSRRSAAGFRLVQKMAASSILGGADAAHHAANRTVIAGRPESTTWAFVRVARIGAASAGHLPDAVPCALTGVPRVQTLVGRFALCAGSVALSQTFVLGCQTFVLGCQTRGCVHEPAQGSLSAGTVG